MLSEVTTSVSYICMSSISRRILHWKKVTLTTWLSRVRTYSPVPISGQGTSSDFLVNKPHVSPACMHKTIWEQWMWRQ